MNIADFKQEIQKKIQQNTKIIVYTFSNHLTHTVRNVCQCGRIRPTNPAESWITGLLEACPVLSHQPTLAQEGGRFGGEVVRPFSFRCFLRFLLFSTEEEQNPQYCSSAPSSEVVSQSIFRGAEEELRHSMRQKVV